jgi:hypothetical protein
MFPTIITFGWLPEFALDIAAIERARTGGRTA